MDIPATCGPDEIQSTIRTTFLNEHQPVVIRNVMGKLPGLRVFEPRCDHPDFREYLKSTNQSTEVVVWVTNRDRTVRNFPCRKYLII